MSIGSSSCALRKRIWWRRERRESAWSLWRHPTQIPKNAVFGTSKRAAKFSTRVVHSSSQPQPFQVHYSLVRLRTNLAENTTDRARIGCCRHNHLGKLHTAELSCIHEHRRALGHPTVLLMSAPDLHSSIQSQSLHYQYTQVSPHQPLSCGTVNHLNTSSQRYNFLHNDHRARSKSIGHCRVVP